MQRERLQFIAGAVVVESLTEFVSHGFKLGRERGIEVQLKLLGIDAALHAVFLA